MDKLINKFFRSSKVSEERKEGPIYYHYTNRRAADSISLEGIIRNTGDGVLLNTMEPELYYRNEILLNNYGDNAPLRFENRADYCVRILPSKLTAEKLIKVEEPSDRLYYLYKDDIRVKQHDVFDKPECKREAQTAQPRNISTTQPRNISTTQPRNISTTQPPVQQPSTSSRSLRNVDDKRDVPVPPSVRNVMTPSVPNIVTPSVPNVQETASTSRSLYDLQDEPRGESVNVSVTRQSTSYSRSSYAENKDDPHVTFKRPKSSKMTKIKVELRRDIKLSQRFLQEYQDERVTIFAFEWMKDGLERIRNLLDVEALTLHIDDSVQYRIDVENLSLKHLQIIARNESSNTNGRINFDNYNGLQRELIYSLKDLNRLTVIVGKDQTTHFGGYPKDNKRTAQTEPVYVCDLSGLQFQQTYNTGRLVLVGRSGQILPKGLLDDFIYERVVNEKKPTIRDVRNDNSGRFIDQEHASVYFDAKAYVKFVANDVVLAGIALNSCATEPLNFKFLKYGTGYFAGPFRTVLERFIQHGVAEGLDRLIGILPHNHWIKSVELPFFEPSPAILDVCVKHRLDVKFCVDDALKSTRVGTTTATTNTADPHAMTGNKMGMGSVDSAIAENLRGKAIKFSPIINKAMKECFV